MSRSSSTLRSPSSCFKSMFTEVGSVVVKEAKSFERSGMLGELGRPIQWHADRATRFAEARAEEHDRFQRLASSRSSSPRSAKTYEFDPNPATLPMHAGA